MTTPDPKPAPMPGRRYQFSLAGLLGLTTIIAVGLALLKWVQVKSGMDAVEWWVVVIVTASALSGALLFGLWQSDRPR
jgi:hypothetical protein